MNQKRQTGKNKVFHQGDIIMMNFDPVKGHEQAGRRPAVIISNNFYNEKMGLAIVCPISNQMTLFPTHISLDDRCVTTGKVFCEHCRTVDLQERKAAFVEKMPDDIFEEIESCVISCIEKHL